MINLLILITLAILIEAIWETIKMVWQDGKIQIDKIGALLVSLVVCFSVRLDIFVLLDITSTIPYLGIFLTGILLSRGSNFIHDLISKLSKVKE